MKLAILAAGAALAAASPRAATHAEYNVFAKVPTPRQRLHSGVNLTADAQAAPQQVHLALAGLGADGYATGYSVAWYTEADVNCFLRWGTGAELVNATAAAGRRQYVTKGGYHHHTAMGPLVDGAMYSYRILCDGGAASAVLGTKFEVRMHGAPKTMSVYGDMGFLGAKERSMVMPLERGWSAIPTRDVLEDVLNDGGFDAVWHVGDISYADDAYDQNVVGGLYEQVYNGYMNWMQNITAAVPYMVSVGNHEAECHSPACTVGFLKGRQLANFTAYNARFQMPAEESGGVQNMWYSYNYGPAHIVSVNTETDFPGAGEEKKGPIFASGHFGADGAYLKWLEADLAKAAADRAAGKISFIIAGGHRPVDDSIVGVQALFAKYKVDLYLCGHEHSYSRSFKSCGGSACRGTMSAPGNTTHVVVGGAGNDETPYGHVGPTAGNPKTPFFTAEMGTGFLTFHNATTLEWRFVSSLNRTRVVDQFFLNRQL